MKIKKSDIDFVISEALMMQGCLPPDECDANRDLIRDIAKALHAMRLRDSASEGRDAVVVGQFLEARGLTTLKGR